MGYSADGNSFVPHARSFFYVIPGLPDGMFSKQKSKYG
jgi:hypothetical protein